MSPSGLGGTSVTMTTFTSSVKWEYQASHTSFKFSSSDKEFAN